MGIDTLLSFIFYVSIFALIARALNMVVSDYPRFQTFSLGFDLIQLLIGIAYLVWVSLIKFGVL